MEAQQYIINSVSRRAEQLASGAHGHPSGGEVRVRCSEPAFQL